MREPNHPKHRGPGRILVLGAILGVVGASLGLTALASAQGQGGNADCPAGTTELAKFNFDENLGEYVEEGGPGPVTITNGTATGGDFTSTVPIGAVVVKGGSGPVANKTDLYNPAVTSGSFNNVGLLNAGGNVPDVSNVKFCSALPEIPPETPPGGGGAAQPVPGQARFTG